jgi:hypothetical protein
MKIFYINVIEQNAGWGTEYFVNQGFLNNGHETHNLDFRKNRLHLSKKFLEAPDFDVLLLQRGDYFPVDLIKACNRPRFFWATELVSRRSDQDLLLQSHLFQHIFVHTLACKEEIVRKGWMEPAGISIMLNGFGESVHRKLPMIEKDIDVLFVGGISNRRRAILDRLRKKYSVQEHRAFGEDLVDLTNRAKIVLNIHFEEFLDTETRVFETLGCGSFLLSERLSSENPFVSGTHLVEVNDIDEMESKIVWYLDHAEERERIAQSGYEEALSKHTYTDRAREIGDLMQGFMPSERYGIPSFDINKIKSYGRKEEFSAPLLRVKSFLGSEIRAIKELLRGFLRGKSRI